MFLFRLPFLPLKLAFFFGRLLGYSRLGYLLIGVVIGLCFAPSTGAEMRARLQQRLQAGSAPGAATPAV